jgi:hypothetical protein
VGMLFHNPWQTLLQVPRGAHADIVNFESGRSGQSGQPSKFKGVTRPESLGEVGTLGTWL